MAELDGLLADASLVVGYGARTGSLDTTGLAEAVAAVQAKRAAGEVQPSAETATLINALNLAVKAIYPVTLIDLGSRYRPFPTAKDGKTVQILVTTAACLLIAFTGYYTWIYIQATEVLSGLTAIQDQNAVDKVARLYRTYQSNPAVVSSTTGVDAKDDMIFENWLKAYEELYTVNTDMDIYIPMAQQLQKTEGRVPVLSLLGSAMEGGQTGPAAPQEGVTAKQMSDQFVASHKGQAYPSLDQQFQAATPTAAVSAPTVDATPAPAAGLACLSGPDSSPQTASAQDQIKASEEQRFCFLEEEGLRAVAMETSQDIATQPQHISILIASARQIIELYGVFILPTLYGMMGTLVFELRNILNPMRPNAKAERIVVRTLLGGLAGLSIMFLFKPIQAAGGNTLPTGVAVFGIAFILGFSIDVFFSLLDRLVNTVSQMVSGAGARS